MRKRKTAILCMSLTLTASMLGGCGTTTKPETSIQPSTAEVVIETVAPSEEPVPTWETQQPEQEVLPSEETQEPVQEASPSPEAVEIETFSFAEITNIAFDFSSGVGGWSTEMEIEEDGSFNGNYHDSDMGDTGEDYPDGTLYVCTFKGKFSTPVKVNDYAYKMKLDTIEVVDKKDVEEIVDGTRYIYTDPYGLDNAKDIYLYLPGAPLKNLPESYIEWIQGKCAIQEGDKVLPFYGLYSEAEGQGWSSYRTTNAYPIDMDLESVEKESAKIDEELEKALAQLDMNQLAAEKYRIWDDELNAIWRLLKSTLDEEDMAKLTKEEREWIAYKEKEVKKAGKEAEGGSLQPFLESITAAKLTKERVYELAKIVRSWD